MSDLGWWLLSRQDKRGILRGVEMELPPGGPHHVEVHPSDGCNLDCFFCATSPWRASQEMPVDLFEEILAQMRRIGSVSLGLAGGGEPLLHSRLPELLSLIDSSERHISYLTTNGVLLSDDISEHLVDRRCDLVSISVNAADERSYAEMMGTGPETFQRVLTNVRTLLSIRRRRRATHPRVHISFKIYRGSHRTIPRMFELAQRLGVDGALFAGLSGLESDRAMMSRDRDAAFGTYESILRRDEWETMAGISDLEEDISPRIDRIEDRLRTARPFVSRYRRLRRLLRRGDLNWQQKLWRIRRRLDLEGASSWRDSCLIPWYMMVVRANGTVPLCCIQQGKILGDVRHHTLQEIWRGREYAKVREELRRILTKAADWRFDPADNTYVVPMCAVPGGGGCLMRNFYYRFDLPFARRLDRLIGRLAATGRDENRGSPPRRSPATSPLSARGCRPAPVRNTRPSP